MPYRLGPMMHVERFQQGPPTASKKVEVGKTSADQRAGSCLEIMSQCLHKTLSLSTLPAGSRRRTIRQDLFTTCGLRNLSTVHTPTSRCYVLCSTVINIISRVETVERGCSIDNTPILIGRHFYPRPARTGTRGPDLIWHPAPT